MAQQLTERQQQIKVLLDQGKKPREVAEILGISENAVYQHRRRMQTTKNAKATTGKRRGRPPKPKPPVEQPPPFSIADRVEVEQVHLTVAPMDPLEAIAARRSEIGAKLLDLRTLADESWTVAAGHKEALDAAMAEAEPELYRLDTAEQVLTGQLKPAAPKASKAKAANGKADTPPAAIEAAAQDAAAEAPDVTEERPGVETVPEFRQEDAFAS
jgi:hypothetical protein